MTKPPISCEEVLEHLVAYLDREIDADAAAAIEQHLQDCRACFSRAEFERKFKAKVHAAGAAAVPARLQARIKRIVETF